MRACPLLPWPTHAVSDASEVQCLMAGFVSLKLYRDACPVPYLPCLILVAVEVRCYRFCVSEGDGA
jgi:hypothetical protein